MVLVRTASGSDRLTRAESANLFAYGETRELVFLALFFRFIFRL